MGLQWGSLRLAPGSRGVDAGRAREGLECVCCNGPMRLFVESAEQALWGFGTLRVRLRFCTRISPNMFG